MTAFNAKRDAAVADDYLANHAACGFCGHSTPTKDMAVYGARCRPCFDAYCAEANPAWWPNRPLTADERASVIRKAKRAMQSMQVSGKASRQWAEALRSREEAGEVLTRVQRESWRTALRAAPVAAVGDEDAA